MSRSPSWRIDELAHEAGLTVDTIRYYAREGLLHAPVKQGRNRLYGPEHLDRLDRIRELQGQRFSLAAIRAIVDVDRPGLEGLFTAAGPRATRSTELDREVGLDADLVAGLRDVGLLPDPAEFGGEAYDDTDLGAAARGRRAAVDRHDPGDPARARRASTSTTSARCRRDVLDMLSGRANPAGTPTSWSRSRRSSPRTRNG